MSIFFSLKQKNGFVHYGRWLWEKEKGKIPPQAIDLEEVVLGAMMIDKKGVDDVIDILHPEAFYKQANQFIFEAIFALFENSEPVDLLTVSHQLKKDEKLKLVGGDFYLISLTQKVSSSAHIEFHARIILQKFIQRSLIKISSEIIEEAYDETKDVFDLLDNAEAKLYEVTQGNIKKSSESARDLVHLAKKKIEEIELIVEGNALKVTASFGVSDNQNCSNIDEMLQKADKLLYTAKESGRNLVRSRLNFC